MHTYIHRLDDVLRREKKKEMHGTVQLVFEGICIDAMCDDTSFLEYIVRDCIEFDQMRRNASLI